MRYPVGTFQPDGKLVGVGTLTGTTTDQFVFRLNTNGTLDGTFSNDGFDVQGNLAGGNRGDTSVGVELLFQRQIVTFGNSDHTVLSAYAEDSTLLLYSSTGSLGGFGLYSTTGWRGDFASELAERSDGSLVAAGWTNVGAGVQANGALWAWSNAGAPLTTFGNNGTQFYDTTRREQFFAVATDAMLTLAGGFTERSTGVIDLLGPTLHLRRRLGSRVLRHRNLYFPGHFTQPGKLQLPQCRGPRSSHPAFLRGISRSGQHRQR